MNIEQQIREYDEWFSFYDMCVTQFERKKFLFENGYINESDYLLEKNKILQLHLEAEEKAKKMNVLRTEINSISNK